jgi:glycogen operon protein
MTGADWSASATRSLAVLLNGDAITEPGPRGETISDQSFLLLFNAADHPVPFTLPAADAAAGWIVVVDTADPAAAVASGDDGSAGAPLGPASIRELPGRAVVVLQAVPRSD